MTRTIAFGDYTLRNRRQVMKQITEALERPYLEIKGCQDIWVRDFMPFQRHDRNFVKYKYNPDYLQTSERNRKYRTDIDKVEIVENPGKEGAKSASIDTFSHSLKKEIITTDLVIDGGNMIKCRDKKGKPCVIMTQKVLFENAGKSHRETLTELENVLGAEIILITWDKSEPYGHADGMVRSLGKGRLLLNCYREMDEELHYQLLSALQERFDIAELAYGKALHSDSWCHINYLELDKNSLVPALHIPSDSHAKEQIEKFTDKTCHLIYMPEIVKDGGALNCISWEIEQL